MNDLDIFIKLLEFAERWEKITMKDDRDNLEPKVVVLGKMIMNETIPSYTVGFGTPQTVMNPAMQETPVYIPTPFIVPPKIEVGENWFVKLPGSSMIQNVRIVDITEKTVNLNDLNSAKIALGRYKKTDVEFVEKVE